MKKLKQHCILISIFFLTVVVLVYLIAKLQLTRDQNGSVKIVTTPMAPTSTEFTWIHGRSYIEKGDVHLIDDRGWDSVVAGPSLATDRDSNYNLALLSPNQKHLLIRGTRLGAASFILDRETGVSIPLNPNISASSSISTWLSDNRLRIFTSCEQAKICEMYESASKSEPQKLERKNFKTIELNEVLIPYPADWVQRKLGKSGVEFDPPDEGPNPYSEEMGEGTNPLDDIQVTLGEENNSEIINQLKDGEIWDIRSTIINDHLVYRYGVPAISSAEEIIVIIDNTHQLRVSASDDSISVAEDLIRTILF